ncbi:MAG: hypothetical protein SFW67_22470 [Myxococcaceae bacterium]|nr:hypothetical protein [Myxococcaceae bacterium]
MTASYEASSTYVGGIVKALRALSLLDPPVMARLSEAQQAIVASPWSKGWWPGEVAEGIAQAVLEVHGPETLERVGFEAVTRSVGPIITPLISVIGAIFGLTPPSLFERMADLSSTSIKGVSLAWRSTAPTEGTLTVTYPIPLAPLHAPLWRGACRYILETARVEGRVTGSHVSGSTLTLAVSWR